VGGQFTKSNAKCGISAHHHLLKNNEIGRGENPILGMLSRLTLHVSFLSPPRIANFLSGKLKFKRDAPWRTLIQGGLVKAATTYHFPCVNSSAA